ncbi:MAG: hypothetical protein A3K18_22735 [Lentisphaerae bacterium RIFOXYA12_64_32]|nr:MAG: hypothetical protein A3K18_22735 [Lentisphaerae bacterium RIFOXYA12_64_32]
MFWPWSRSYRFEADAPYVCPRLQVGAPLLVAAPAVNVQIKLVSGEAQLEVREATDVTYTSFEGEKTAKLEPGRHTLKLRATDKAVLAGMTDTLAAQFAQFAAAQTATGSGQGVSPVPLCMLHLPVCQCCSSPCSRAVLFLVDNDGHPARL